MAPSSSRPAASLHRLLPRAAGLESRRRAAHSPSPAARRRRKTRPLRSVATCASLSGDLRRRSMATDLWVFDSSGLCRHPFRAAFSARALLTSPGGGATACFCGRLGRRRRGDGAMSGVYGCGPYPSTGLVSSTVYKLPPAWCPYLGAMASVATPTAVAFLVVLLLALRELFLKILQSHCRDGYGVT
jgi:hypothetical protein